MEQFYTTEQVAKFLQLHPFTILKFIREGKLKGVKIGRMYRIMESDMKAFLEERSTGNKKADPKPKKQQQQEEVQIPTPKVEQTVDKIINTSQEEIYPIDKDNIPESIDQNAQTDPYYII